LPRADAAGKNNKTAAICFADIGIAHPVMHRMVLVLTLNLVAAHLANLAGASGRY
jgi:hypothetical protein